MLEIKGIQDGLIITVPDGEWVSARAALLDTIHKRSEFLQGARLAIQVEDRSLNAAELGSLREALSSQEITLAAVLSTSEITRNAAANLGIALDLSKFKAESMREHPLDTSVDGEEAIFIGRTLRSGHNIQYPGHVFVIGDVNPGAEVIAGGNIVVWGRVRGLLHAGAAGDETARVCALDLSPTQLRIAGHVSVSPSPRKRPRPEVAYIKDGQLVAEEWTKARER